VDATFGVRGSGELSQIKRSYRRVNTKDAFIPPSLSEAPLDTISGMPKGGKRKYVLVDESRLDELTKLESLLKLEQYNLGEQYAMILPEAKVKAHIPIPATRLAVHSLCEAEMRKYSAAIMKLNNDWEAFSKRHHYDRVPPYVKDSFKNAPLEQRTFKLRLMIEGYETHRLRRDRDTMIYEDDLSRFSTAYLDAQIRRRDYDRYYILAARYGIYSEEEFAEDSRPGRRYWVKATTAALMFQQVWNSYWSVEKARRHNAALDLQRIFRGYYAYKQFNPIISLRRKVGRSAVIKYYLLNWKHYVHLIKMIKQQTRWWFIRWDEECFYSLVKHAQDRKQERLQKALKFLRQMRSGVSGLFQAWLDYVARVKYLRMFEKRFVMVIPFGAWKDEWKCARDEKIRIRSAIKLTAFGRMCIDRTRFKKTRAYATILAYFIRCSLAKRCVQRMRDEIIQTAYVTWKPEEEKRIVERDEEGERKRLLAEQEAIVTNEKKVMVKLKKHLKSPHGRLQLTEMGMRIREGHISTDELMDLTLPEGVAAATLAQKELTKLARTCARREGKRNYFSKTPPHYFCADYRCGAVFTTANQYHGHMLCSEIHGPESSQYSHFHVQLRHDAGFQAIRSYLKAKHDFEAIVNNLDLWGDIQDWKRIPTTSDAYKKKAITIYDKYLAIESSQHCKQEFEGLASIREILKKIKHHDKKGYMQPSRLPRSWFRKLFRLQGKTYTRWTSEFVVQSNIFEELEWLCFLSVFRVMEKDEGFDKSPQRIMYDEALEEDRRAREERLLNEYKYFRLNGFRDWASVFRARDHVIEKRAYELVMHVWEKEAAWQVQKACMQASMDTAVDMTYAEQATHEERQAVMAEAVDWTFMDICEETYEQYVKSLLQALLSMPGSRRAIEFYANEIIRNMNEAKMQEEMNASNDEAEQTPRKRSEKDSGKNTLSSSSLRSSESVAAVVRIQKRMRGVIHRKRAKAIFVKRYQKKFDGASGYPYYYNTVTEESSWDRPKITEYFFPKSNW
jgi:hypothetical protein